MTIDGKPDNEMAYETYLYLGFSYGKLHHYSEAIEAFKKALQITPNGISAHFFLGVAYFSNEDKSSAFDQYKILKGIDTEMANKLFNLIFE